MSKNYNPMERVKPSKPLNPKQVTDQFTTIKNHYLKNSVVDLEFVERRGDEVVYRIKNARTRMVDTKDGAIL